MDTLKRLYEALSKRRSTVIALASVVVFITTYILILPAFTLDKEEAAEQGGIDVPTVEQVEETGQDAEDELSTEQPKEESKDAEEQSSEKENKDTEEPSSEKESPEPKASAVPVNLTFENDDYTISVEGKDAGLHEDMSVEVSEIDKGKKGQKKKYESLYKDALKAVQEEKGGETVTDFAFAKFYYITIMDGTDTVEPSDPVDVTISYEKEMRKELKAADPSKVRIIHFAEDKSTGEITPEVLDAKDTDITVKSDMVTEATFAADSFSVYAVVYTVDFSYEVDGVNYEAGIKGGDCITLRQLAEVLKFIKDDPDTEENEIDHFMAEVKSVKASDKSLLDICLVDEDTTVGALKEARGLECEYSAELSKDDIAAINERELKDGDWAIISLKPFDTKEELTVSMNNGDEFIITVTDAQEINDPSSDTIKADKSYLICYEVNGTYYLLKNDGSVDSSHTPNDFENLNSTYCWSFNYVFEEKHLEHSLTYHYYLIRPIDNKTKTIALNEEGQSLVQSSNNNVAVVPAEGGGFNLIGYNEVKLNFGNGAFFADQLPEGNNGITVHIYEMDTLPSYSYTARSADENRGTVTIAGGTEKTDANGHYYEAESNSDKKNAGRITATPTNHQNPDLPWWDPNANQNKWEFDHWEQDGVPLDRNQYGRTINTNTLPIPFNGSNLVAYFKQNPNYVVPDSEKEPSSFADMSDWYNNLTNRSIPLDASATEKTAEVYDYENRIYRVDITSKANFETFNGNVDMAFCLDVSNSMKFPSKLVENTTLPIYQINNTGRWYDNRTWLDRSRGYDNPYYLIADPNGTATVFKIYYKGDEWRAIDASRPNDNNSSQWFRIGNDFETTWTKGKNPDNKHPFNVGDNDDTWYIIYDAGDEGRNRFYYLNQSLLGATTDLQTIKNTLAVAGAQSPNVRVAYNTFFKDLGSQRQDFQTVTPLTIDFSYSAGGGTRPDQSFNDARSFSWSGNDRYVILITDGAPQGVRTDHGEPKTTTSEEIYNKVRQSASALKTEDNVKIITIGLSMDDVTSGKQLLYDLADNDKDGNKMFYMAESASDLPNILRQITKTIMDDAIVYGDVTDTVGEAFYPVDKITGLPLEPGNKIDIEGCLTTDPAKVAGIVQPDGKTIKWLNQAIDQKNGWHGSIYVKAKEDLLGGNAVKTNGNASIEAKKYRMGDTEYTFDQSLVYDKLKSLNIDFETPRVNVNELSFPSESTEWTVYLGTEVDPAEQMKTMYEDIRVQEVINTDGTLHYPIAPNSIVDNRTSVESGTAVTYPLAPLILDLIKKDATLKSKYVSNGKLNWPAFLADIQTSEGVVVPYHEYGIEGEDSNITITLTKETFGDEKDINESPHATTVVNGTDGEVPVEKYVLTVQYNPDYDHVLPKGQGGHGTYEYHTGIFGTMYQGHAAGRETSENTHEINVFAKKLMLQKVDQSGNTINRPAVFGLYRKATDSEMTDSSVEKVSLEGLNGKYVLVQWLTTTNGNVTTESLKLLPGNESYYLKELEAPDGYIPLDEILKVSIDMEGHNTWTKKSDNTSSQTKPDPYVLSDWRQEATIKVTAIDGSESGKAIRVIPEGEHGITYDSDNDTTDASVSYRIINNFGVVLPDTGGIGTTIFYILGSILVLGCSVILISRRRIGRKN